ncbi:MAG: uroporphyrinogen decarboxylase family protein [Gemmatimonadota bacterium]
MTAPMTPRQRFQALMSFQPFDRLPLVEWAGWWTQTIDRWHGEQLPADLTDRYDICRHFGLDVYMQEWFRCRAATCPAPPAHGAGIVRDLAEYERLLPHLYPLPVVDGARWRQWRRLQESGEVVLWITLEGYFWFARGLLGIEPHLYAFYDQPDLIHRMNQDLTDHSLAVLDELAEVCVPDFMTFAEDMSYNHGSMLSKDLFDEFMAPYYHQILPRLRDLGVIAVIDSDGDITVPAHWFEAAGLQGILPLERQAGVDMARLRREHPRMRFIGHFDKMVMHRGEAALRAEFERLLPVAAQGGFIVSCDHQTPPGVSYDDYQLYLSLFREYAARAGEMSQDLLRPAAGPTPA